MNKATIEKLLEKMNIRVKLDLSLYKIRINLDLSLCKILKFFTSSIMYFLIVFMVYQTYKQGEQIDKQNKQLNMFYSKLEISLDSLESKLAHSKLDVQILENKIKSLTK